MVYYIKACVFTLQRREQILFRAHLVIPASRSKNLGTLDSTGWLRLPPDLGYLVANVLHHQVAATHPVANLRASAHAQSPRGWAGIRVGLISTTTTTGVAGSVARREDGFTRAASAGKGCRECHGEPGE